MKRYVYWNTSEMGKSDWLNYTEYSNRMVIVYLDVPEAISIHVLVLNKIIYVN